MLRRGRPLADFESLRSFSSGGSDKGLEVAVKGLDGGLSTELLMRDDAASLKSRWGAMGEIG